MKKTYIIFGGALIVLIVGALVFTKFIKPQLDNRTVSSVVPTTIENKEMDFAFTYPSGETGYSVIEPQTSTSSESLIKKVYLLLDTEEYISFQGEKTDGDAPPTVSIFVIKESEEAEDSATTSRMMRLRTWAEQNSSLSSYKFKTSEIEELDLDGVKAIKYKTEALYSQEVYLANYKGNIYVFTGQYKEETDDIKNMFGNLMNSVMFY